MSGFMRLGGAAGASTGGASPFLLSATLALLITNAATLFMLWRRRSATTTGKNDQPQALTKNDDILADGAAVDAASDDDDSTVLLPACDSSNTARLAAGASQPTSQCFRSTHTAFEGTPRQKTVKRTVYCRDTNEYLRGISITPAEGAAATAASAASASVDSSSSSSSSASESWANCSVITSVPDVSETGLTLAAWRPWFRSACSRIMDRVPAQSVSIFYQTDIKIDGRWISKAQLVMQAAEKSGVSLVWHKIVVVNSLNTIRGSTAGFVHLLCFSRDHREDSRWATPDLLSHRGTMMWKRAMGLRACEFATKYVSLHVPSSTKIIDPFCGSGSILATANTFGLDSEGVDHSRKRCSLAAELKVSKMLEEINSNNNGNEGASAASTSGDATGEDGESASAASSIIASTAPIMSADEIARRARKKARKETRQAKQLTQRQQQQLEREEKHAKMKAQQLQQLQGQ